MGHPVLILYSVQSLDIAMSHTVDQKVVRIPRLTAGLIMDIHATIHSNISSLMRRSKTTVCALHMHFLCSSNLLTPMLKSTYDGLHA